MEPILWLTGGLGALWLGRKALQAFQDPEGTARAQERQHALLRAERGRRARLHLANQQGRDLQLALLRLGQAPDFRRAASFAAAATAVPVAFKRRQFRRFRDRMVRHFAARLAAGGDATVLTSSLATLLKALGIPAYEADYVRTEAERSVAAARRRPDTSYGQRLAELQREHQQRTEAIRAQANLDQETRELLLEAESTRHREALERLGGYDSDTPTTP